MNLKETLLARWRDGLTGLRNALTPLAEADAHALADVRALDASVAHVARECGMWRLYTPTAAFWLTSHDATPDGARAEAVALLRAWKST